MPARVFANCPCCGSSNSDGSGSGSGSQSGSQSGSEGTCAGWYCCPCTGEINYVANCAALIALDDGCGEHTCATCGWATYDDLPAAVYFNFVDYGVIIGPVSRSGPFYTSGPGGTSLPHNETETISLAMCNGLPELADGIIFGLLPGVGGHPLWDATAYTPIVQRCRPFYAVVENTTLGNVVITEA